MKKSANGLFCYQVKGRGTLALSGPGGLHSLTLAEGESVRVNPRHIVAWDACLDVKAPEREGGSTKEVPVVAPATPVAEMEWQDRALALAKKSVSWTASKTAQVSRSALQSAKERVLGSQEFYTVTGPGLLLLSRSASSKIGGAFKEE